MLGRFNTIKLECFADTIDIQYLDSGEVVKEEYEIDSRTKQFKLKPSLVKKQCKVTTVKASVSNVFGEIIYEKVLELTDSKVDGKIRFVYYEEKAKEYLSFSSNTPGLLDCYNKVKIGKSIFKEYKNPLDISELYPPSCHKKNIQVHLLSPFGNKTLHEYVRQPSLNPPSHGTKFDAYLNTEDQRIHQTTSPPATLICLKAFIMIPT